MSRTGRIAFVEARLAYEIDVVDAAGAQADGSATIVDTRKTRSWDNGHVTGALHLPSNRLDGDGGLDDLPRDCTIVVYGWGPGCNGATRTALALLKRGFDVREMIGGFEYWARNGFPVEDATGDATGPADPMVTAER
ncbi:rhodanese-like domain-containing protein [Arthrobacter monumenti]